MSGRRYVVGLCLLLPSVLMAADDHRPSILLITGDDLGHQLGCYGDRVATTPHMDRLGREGLRFTQAYVTQSSCSSSRSSILTGLYPHQNGQIGLAHLGYRMKSDTWPTLPGQLAKAGYRTGVIGKVHVGPDRAIRFDFRRNDIGQTREIPQVERNLAEFLATVKDRPFFLMLNLFDPHGPFLRDVQGSPKVKVEPGQVTRFPFLKADPADAKERIADFYTCVNRMDEIIGAVMNLLESRGAASNLLVVLVGDNGPPFPGAKCSIYEAGLRVPCIVWYPGRVPRGKTSDALVCLVDLMPTLLEAAQAEIPAGLAGRSLWPVLRGEDAGWRQTLAAEYTSHEPDMYFPQRSIRDGRYKLIVSLMHDATVSKKREYDGAPLARLFPRYANTPPVELYDLKEDPWETRNLAGSLQHQEILKSLTAELHAWRKATQDPLLEPAEFEKLTAWQIPFSQAYAKRKTTSTQPGREGPKN